MNRIKRPILLILVFVHFLCLGQDKKGVSPPNGVGAHENILTEQSDDTTKVNALNTASEKFARRGNYDSATIVGNLAKVLAEKIDFKKGEANACRCLGLSCYDRGEYAKALEYYTEGLNISLAIGYKTGIAGSYGRIGTVYSDLGNYSTALEYYFKALGINQEINNKMGEVSNLGNIGVAYMEEQNNSKALEYDLKALAIAQDIGDKNGSSINLCNVANVYYNLGNRAKAFDYYLRAREIYEELGNKYGIASIDNNVGSLYIEHVEYSKAEAFLDKALNEYREIGNRKGMAETYSNVGSLSYREKKYPVARKYADSALILAREMGYKLALRETYQLLMSLDTVAGDYKKAFRDHNNYVVYRDSIDNEESVRKSTQRELQYEFAMREDSIQAVHQKEMIVKEDESRRKSIITGSAIVIALLSVLLGIVFINRQQIKRKRDKILFERNMIASEQEKVLLKVDNQRVEGELTQAKIKLEEYVKSLVEKNGLLEKLNEDVEYLKNLKSKEIDEKRIEHLYNLNKVTILTEEDWSKFKDLFDHAYKGFFIRLKEKLPDLTQAEMRLVCLTKLKLDTKQMAGILGVSFATIRQTRYRLRKKLGQSEEDSIDDIVESV